MLARSNNVQEQYNTIKMLKTLTKQEGNWVLGMLETAGSNVGKGVKITREWVNELMIKEKLRLMKPLVKPLNINNFKYKNCVTELITPLDLQNEGVKMGHCVGGYSYNLENDISRLFHIEIDGIGSTFEVSLVNFDGSKFSVKQHLGRYPEKGNLTPTNKCRGIGIKLTYYLAKQELSDDEFKNFIFVNQPSLFSI
jgi:hypothetical protein